MNYQIDNVNISITEMNNCDKNYLLPLSKCEFNKILNLLPIYIDNINKLYNDNSSIFIKNLKIYLKYCGKNIEIKINFF